MRDEYDQSEQLRSKRDAELTLSMTAVLGLFFGGVLVCAFFFGLGFAVGRWGPSDHGSAELFQKAQSVLPASAGTKSKPSATPQAESGRAVAANVPPVVAPAVAPPVQADSSLWTAQSAARTSQSQLTPATVAQPVRQAYDAAPSGAIMVQIAAVAHEEDAAVLVSALRRRNYAVAVHRVAADDLLHVQIGPFADRGQAYAMRNKLLSDGYNAIVQP